MAIKKYHVSKNLFSIDFEHDDYSTLVYHYAISGLTPNSQYTCSTNFVQSGSSASIWFGGTSTGTNGVSNENPKTMTANANGEIDFYINHNTGNAYSQVVNGTAWIMVNSGSTPLPYEPYGNTWNSIPYRKYGTETDTLTSLPADVIADGQSASANIIGNMNQQGTPSPSSIIMPSECGNKTANLFDYTAATIGKYINASGQEATSSGSVPASKLNHTDYITIQSETNYNIRATSTGNNTCAFCWFDSSKTLLSRQTFDVSSGDYTQTAESPSGAAYMIINYITSNQETVMVNIGSTALPYQPYGIQIPILSANTTTPVYLGEVQTTRKINKLILTGEEGWTITSNGVLRIGISGQLRPSIPICTHYLGSNATAWSNIPDKSVTVSIAGYLAIYDTSYDNTTDFKTFLAQQYANGTPVTVWYVLATPTTGILNEPIRKIGNYADSVAVTGIPTTGTAESFDIDTTLKPSEVQLTYHGWHDATVKEWDGSEWQ